MSYPVAPKIKLYVTTTGEFRSDAYTEGYLDAARGDDRCPLRTLTDPQYVAGYASSVRAKEANR